MLRIAFCRNAGPSAGSMTAAVVVPASLSWDALLKLAANKLRLTRSQMQRVRLFVWRTGFELPKHAALGLSNGDTVAISLGEEYGGPYMKRSSPAWDPPDEAARNEAVSERNDSAACPRWLCECALNRRCFAPKASLQSGDWLSGPGLSERRGQTFAQYQRELRRKPSEACVR